MDKGTTTKERTMTNLATIADWNDPIKLRARLAEIHNNDFIGLRTLKTEKAIVRTLVRLTGLSASVIRTNADEDALFV